MAALVIETPPSVEPVTLDAAKLFLRVEIDADDSLISSLIVAARELCEAFTARSFCIKGYRQSLDSFPYFTDSMQSQLAYPPAYYSLPRYSTTLWNYSQMIKLFVSPLVAVDRITYWSFADQQRHDLVLQPLPWYPGTIYALADQISDNNGNVQKVTTAGTAGNDPPIWNKTVGGFTIDAGTLVWQNMGSTPAGSQFGTYLVDTESEPPRIFPGPPGFYWPPVLYVPNAVQIHYRAGYSTDGAKVPGRVKTAMLQLVSGWYERREAISPLSLKSIPNHVEALLWSVRVLDMQPTRG